MARLSSLKVHVLQALNKMRLAKQTPMIYIKNALTSCCVQPLSKSRWKILNLDGSLPGKFIVEIHDFCPTHCFLCLGSLIKVRCFGEIPILYNNLLIFTLSKDHAPFQNMLLDVNNRTFKVLQ